MRYWLYEHDPDARVRFQLALTLGRVEGQRALDTLAALATAGGASDHWFRIAILSSAADRPFQLFERLPARDRGWQDTGVSDATGGAGRRQARPPGDGGACLRAASPRSSRGRTQRPGRAG